MNIFKTKIYYVIKKIKKSQNKVTLVCLTRSVETEDLVHYIRFCIFNLNNEWTKMLDII